MAKRKKLTEKVIGVKHYLNKKLKGKEIDGIRKYPVYIRLTYDGALINMKSSFYSTHYFRLARKGFSYFDLLVSESDFNSNEFEEAMQQEAYVLVEFTKYYIAKFKKNPLKTIDTLVYSKLFTALENILIEHEILAIHNNMLRSEQELAFLIDFDESHERFLVNRIRKYIKDEYIPIIFDKYVDSIETLLESIIKFRNGNSERRLYGYSVFVESLNSIESQSFINKNRKIIEGVFDRWIGSYGYDVI